MLKRWSGRLVCMLGGLLLLSAPLAQAEKLILVGDNFCPYNCKDSGNYQGYMVDLLKRIFSEHGYSVEYRLVPWSRAIKMVTAGEADILIANASPNSPDPALAVVLGVDSTCFFTRRGYGWQYNGLQSLERVRLGVIQDYHYDGKGPLDTYIRSHITDTSRVVSAKGAQALENNFNMLVAGRQDVVLDNCSVGSSAVKRLKLATKVVKAGEMPTYHDDLYVSFAPHNPASAQRMQLLAEGMQRLRANGQLQAILDKYGVSDWKPAALPP